MALNLSAWLYPFSCYGSTSILLGGKQAPAGLEEVQDYTFKLHVAKGYVAKEEFPRSRITDGLEIHTYRTVQLIGISSKGQRKPHDVGNIRVQRRTLVGCECATHCGIWKRQIQGFLTKVGR